MKCALSYSFCLFQWKKCDHDVKLNNSQWYRIISIIFQKNKLCANKIRVIYFCSNCVNFLTENFHFFIIGGTTAPPQARALMIIDNVIITIITIIIIITVIILLLSSMLLLLLLLLSTLSSSSSSSSSSSLSLLTRTRVIKSSPDSHQFC